MTSSPAPKRTKTAKKTPKEKKPVKSKKQATIFDHFKPKQEKEENGETKPVYAQKLLDMIELVKSLETERATR